MPSRLWYIIEVIAKVLLHILEQREMSPQEHATALAHLAMLAGDPHVAEKEETK